MKFVLSALALVFFTACGTRDVEPAKPEIALIMKSLANEFFATMADGARRHQEANSERYELIVNGIKDERDLSRQVALVDEMVARGVDAIVIAPADSKALTPALRRASEQGVAIVNIDNKLDPEILAAEGLTIPFVGPDNRAGAQRVAEHLANDLKAGDRVLILEGTRTSFNAQQRKLGFEDALQAAGVIVADSQSAQWEMSLANTLATSMLSEHPDVAAILACNDSMALGAVAAVQAAGRQGEVKIVGFDNISAVQRAIVDGKIVATADQYAEELASFGIDIALQLLADGGSLEDRETPVDLITAADLTAKE